jgi:sRNA-binding carbon storage regulator CsrA
MSTRSPIQGMSIIVRIGDIISIGDKIKVHAEKAGSGRVRVIIQAPKEIKITNSAKYTQSWGVDHDEDKP